MFNDVWLDKYIHKDEFYHTKTTKKNIYLYFKLKLNPKFLTLHAMSITIDNNQLVKVGLGPRLSERK